jgi:autotransporter translocation and assembly factor TamB
LRRALRIAVAGLLLLPLLAMVLVASAVLVARTDRGRERIRQALLERARRTVPGIDLDRIGGDFLNEIVLEGLSVWDRQGRRAVRVRSVSIRYDVLALVRRRVVIHEARIEAPTVLARPGDGGASNLGQLTARATPAPAARQPPAAAPAGGERSAWTVRIDRLVIAGGAADVRTADGETFRLDGVTADGSLALDGDRLDAAFPVVEIGATRADRRYHLGLSARAFADGQRVDLRVPHLALSGVAPGGEIVLRASAVGPRDRVAVEAELSARDAGRVQLEGTVGLGGAAAGAAAAPIGAYRLQLALMAVDPAALGEGLPRGHVSARLAAYGRGVPLQPGAEAHLAVDGAPSRLADVAIKRLHLRLAGAGRRIDADLRADVTTGHVGRHDAAAHPRGSGTVALHIGGAAPAELHVDGRADARGLAIGGYSIAELAVRLQDVRLGARSGHATIAAHGLRVGGGVPPIDTLTFDAQGDGRQLRVRGAATGPRVNAALEAHGAAGARRVAVSVDRLTVDYRNARYRQTVTLTRPTTVEWRAGQEIALGPTALRGDGYRFTGDLSAEGLYRLRRAAGAAADEPLASIKLALRRASFGGLDPFDAAGEATVDADAARARLDAAVGRATVHADASLPLIVRRHGLPEIARHGELALHVKTDPIRLHDLPMIGARLEARGLAGGYVVVDATAGGEIDRPTAHATVELRDITLRKAGGSGRRSSLHAIPGAGATLRLDAQAGQLRLGGRVTLWRAQAATIDAQSAIDLGELLAGHSAADAPLRATVDIAALDLRRLAELSPQMTGVAGTVAGHAQVSGTPRRPEGTADLTLDGLVVDEIAFGPARLHVQADPDRAEAELRIDQQSGGQLHATAALDRARPGTDGAWTWQANVRARDVDLRFIRPFAPRLREIAGTLEATLDASGRRAPPGGEGGGAAPDLRGTVKVTGGRFGITGQPTYEGVELDATVKPGKIELDRLVLHAGGGELTGKGHAVLDGLRPVSATFTADAHHFRVAAGGGPGMNVDGQIAVEAALRESILTGAVRVPQASVWLPELNVTGGGRTLQPTADRPDVRFVDRAARAADAARAQKAAETHGPRLAGLDVDAQADNVVVRSKELDMQLESQLHVGTATEGPARGRPTLSGTVQARSGRISLLGRRFDVDYAKVMFNGSPDMIPDLDIRLVRLFSDAQIAIEIRGTPQHPTLRLLSDPPIYDQQQILSLILTGEAGGAPTSGQSFDPTATVTGLVLGQIADKLAPQLGLDILRIENRTQTTTQGMPTTNTDTRVEVGKYVSNRVYVSYAHVFGAGENENTNEAHVEYRVAARWMIETVFGDAGVGSIDAVWTYRY